MAKRTTYTITTQKRDGDTHTVDGRRRREPRPAPRRTGTRAAAVAAAIREA